MRIYEEDKLDLKTKMLLAGYKTYKTDYFTSPEYRSLRMTMLDHLPKGSEDRFSFKMFPKSEILEAGKYVIDKHFGNVDLLVPFANGDDMESQLVALFGYEPSPEQYDEIIEYINNQIASVRVTDLPVYLNINTEKNGYVATPYFYGNGIMELEFYHKLPACVREIAIEGDCDEDAKCIYVHEMSHALIDRHKGNINNLLHNEAFSIFMEKVAASDIDNSNRLLDLKNFLRIIQVKHNVLENELCEYREEGFMHALASKTYIISTLHATALFDTYQNSSQNTQNEIDNALGKVISGDGILEEVFEHYDASLVKGTKVMQKQIQKYEKQYKRRS